MRRWSLLRLTLLLTALLLGVCACGGAAHGSPTATPESSSTPSSQFTSSDFTTTIPQGWTDQTTNESTVTAISVTGAVLMLLIAPPSFTDRVDEHIDVSLPTPSIPEDQLASYLMSAKQTGATDLSAVQPFNLDGAAGLYTTYTLSSNGVRNRAQDMVVDHGASTYEIVLNTSAADFGQQLPALQQVLDAWKWTS